MKTVLSLEAVQKQELGQIWPTEFSLLTPMLVWHIWWVGTTYMVDYLWFQIIYLAFSHPLSVTKVWPDLTHLCLREILSEKKWPFVASRTEKMTWFCTNYAFLQLAIKEASFLSLCFREYCKSWSIRCLWSLIYVFMKLRWV